MTTPDLKKLKALATDVNLKTVRWYSENHTDNLLIGLLDRRFIAAANPQTILAMIERIESAENSAIYWQDIVKKIEPRIEKMKSVLKEIANEDYRGNRSSASVAAYKCLKELDEQK